MEGPVLSGRLLALPVNPIHLMGVLAAGQEPPGVGARRRRRRRHRPLISGNMHIS